MFDAEISILSYAASDVILIVDDDRTIREVVAEYLQDSGYPVIQAAGGSEALQLIAERPELRVLITDVRMPGMSGIELAEKARRENGSLKIILISGYFQPQPIKQRFLRKPFRMKELEAAVRAELAA